VRHALLAAYAAPVVEDVQEHAFCLREIMHLRMDLESFTTAALFTSQDNHMSDFHEAGEARAALLEEVTFRRSYS